MHIESCPYFSPHPNACRELPADVHVVRYSQSQFLHSIQLLSAPDSPPTIVAHGWSDAVSVIDYPFVGVRAVWLDVVTQYRYRLVHILHIQSLSNRAGVPGCRIAWSPPPSHFGRSALAGGSRPAVSHSSYLITALAPYPPYGQSSPHSPCGSWP